MILPDNELNGFMMDFSDMLTQSRLDWPYHVNNQQSSIPGCPPPRQ